MKLLAVAGVVVVSRATTIVPCVVSKVAVYFLPASRQLGGAWANDDVRGELPSAFGQGVAPVILAPAGTGAAVGGGFDVVAVVLEPGSVVELVATFFFDEEEKGNVWV